MFPSSGFPRRSFPAFGYRKNPWREYSYRRIKQRKGRQFIETIRRIRAPKRLSFYLFLLFFAAAIVLQFRRVEYISLWSDEFRGTLPLIQLPWKELALGNYSWEFNPPLYYLILKAWVSLIGSNSESTMRLLSVIMFCVSLGAIFLLGKTLGNWRVGLALLSVLGFNPLYLAYSTQLRSYPLLILESVLALLLFSKYAFNQRSHKGWLLALGIVLLAASYTHYFGILLILTMILISMSFLVGKGDRRQWLVLGTILLILPFTLPLIGILSKQYSLYLDKASNLIEPYSPLGLNIFVPILSGIVEFDFDIRNAAHILSLLAVLSGIFILFRSGRKFIAIGLTSAILLSSLIVIVISTRNVHMVARYLIHITLLGWIIASLSLIDTEDPLSRYLRGIVILAIGVNGFAGLSRSLNREYFAPNWKSVASILLREAKVGEPIVIMGWDAAPTGYYLSREWLTSYALEDQLESGDPAESYLILDSEYARKLNFIEYSAPIYEDAQWQVRIVRYTLMK